MRLFAAALTLFLAQDKSAKDDGDALGPKDRWVAAYFQVRPGVDVRKELEDMASVDIDFAVLMAEKAADRERVVRALEAAVEKNPRVKVKLAPFLDPAPEGLAARLRGWLEAVPALLRATVDGRSVVWLAPPKKEAPPDPAAFRAAVGDLDLFVVADLAWKDGAPDRRYAWDSSRVEPPPADVASVGPGPDRDDEGGGYRRSWYVARQSGARWAVLESWNGPETGVNEREGRERKFVEFTRNFARRFRDGDRIEPPEGAYSDASKIGYTLQYNPREQGLRLLETDRGRTRTVRLGGVRVLTTRANEKGDVRHIPFDIDDSFRFMRRCRLQVVVEYWDVGRGDFSVEYDSADAALAPDARRVKRTAETPFGNSGGWRKAGFDLPDAWCGNGQEGGADFRLRIEKRGIMILRVLVLAK